MKGKQCTIIWHIDNLKISNMDKSVVEDIINMLNKTFGQESPLVMAQGNVLKYLEMNIDYMVKAKVKIYMYE